MGVLAAVLVNLANQPRYARMVDANKGRPVPEARLLPMVFGGFIFTIGLFWFGWTSDPSISWISPVFAAGFIGAGFNIIFQQCINFLVDTYQLYAASAVSANTFLRSLIAAGLPLAAKPMFNNLGVGMFFTFFLKIIRGSNSLLTTPCDRPGNEYIGWRGRACLACPIFIHEVRHET